RPKMRRRAYNGFVRFPLCLAFQTPARGRQCSWPTAIGGAASAMSSKRSRRPPLSDAALNDRTGSPLARSDLRRRARGPKPRLANHSKQVRGTIASQPREWANQAGLRSNLGDLINAASLRVERRSRTHRCVQRGSTHDPGPPILSLNTLINLSKDDCGRLESKSSDNNATWSAKRCPKVSL